MKHADLGLIGTVLEAKIILRQFPLRPIPTPNTNRRSDCQPAQSSLFSLSLQSFSPSTPATQLGQSSSLPWSFVFSNEYGEEHGTTSHHEAQLSWLLSCFCPSSQHLRPESPPCHTQMPWVSAGVSSTGLASFVGLTAEKPFRGDYADKPFIYKTHMQGPLQ